MKIIDQAVRYFENFKKKYLSYFLKIKKVIEYTNERKIVSTIFQNSDYDFRLFSQGIYKVLLEKCNYYINYKGARLQYSFN